MATEVAKSYASWFLPMGPHEDVSVWNKVDSRAALRDRIFAAVEHIRNHPNNIAAGGGHFEQLL